MRIADSFVLSVGDTGAIWRSHNVEATEVFDSLYDLLATTPDQEHLFVVAAAESH